ncbi:Transport protein TfdK [Sphingobium herbicidovorans NBRC 16415]|uniref:Transport protein TfdK n=1 Tax=Sphingobium herbicidovorans (strain ATCC 700291 / DSM 11019 / CCUG 56400 / KCTC 2939 / LMG 18315 / NBRC 16415 / MH) TaxID=1219045 RepID=A0A086P7T2_SPHHM|nr:MULTISPECIES: MFS transporter [Sphingomonadaceae]KFG89450.1 Transport protein TfdK [Sphingobium herbicidovorans NBRC 16415]
MDEKNRDDSPATLLGEVIDKQSWNMLVVTTVLLSTLMMFVDGYDLQTIAFAAPSIMSEWSLSSAAFGLVFAAASFGMLVGGIVFGWIGDRHGRKFGSLVALVVCGLGSLSVLVARDIYLLSLCRFLTGIGIGGLTPLLYALNQELVPQRFRATVVAVIMMGYMAGSASGGAVAAAFMPHYGWEALFWIGGVLSLLLAGVGYVLLPESVAFLSRRSTRKAELESLLRRIDPSIAAETVARIAALPDVPHAAASRGLSPLFSGRLSTITPLLWLAYVCSSATVFFMISWLPTLMLGAGLPKAESALGLSLFILAGSIGGLVISAFIDRLGLSSITVMPVIGCILLATLAFPDLSSSGYMIAVGICGFFVLGGHQGLNGAAGLLYPCPVRASGIGWALSIAKIGSIAGPLVGGILLATELPRLQLMMIVASPLPIFAVSLILLGLAKSREGRASAVKRIELAGSDVV